MVTEMKKKSALYSTISIISLTLMACGDHTHDWNCTEPPPVYGIDLIVPEGINADALLLQLEHDEIYACNKNSDEVSEQIHCVTDTTQEIECENVIQELQASLTELEQDLEMTCQLIPNEGYIC